MQKVNKPITALYVIMPRLGELGSLDPNQNLSMPLPDQNSHKIVIHNKMFPNKFLVGIIIPLSGNQKSKDWANINFILITDN